MDVDTTDRHRRLRHGERRGEDRDDRRREHSGVMRDGAAQLAWIIVIGLPVARPINRSVMATADRKLEARQWIELREIGSLGRRLIEAMQRRNELEKDC